jgi:phosphocarrier protein HPr
VLASSETIAVLPPDVDLHARPAAAFVRTALGFEAQIAVHVDGRAADAKSLLAVLALGAKRGNAVTLRAEGADAAEALETLTELVATLRE